MKWHPDAIRALMLSYHVPLQATSHISPNRSHYFRLALQDHGICFVNLELSVAGPTTPYVDLPQPFPFVNDINVEHALKHLFDNTQHPLLLGTEGYDTSASTGKRKAM